MITTLAIFAGRWARGEGVVIIHNFTSLNSSGDNIDGGACEAPLTAGPDGYLYGATSAGGKYGDGTIFRVTPTGRGNVLHDFQNTDNTFYQYSGVTLGPDGNYYGTTYMGGDNGTGSIYRITTSGSYTTVHSFGATVNGTNADGTGPWGGLYYDSTTGLFYGTNQGGGQFGYGTVYSVNTSGNIQTLYSFANAATVNSPDGDGNTPQAVLAPGPDGALYGTTLGGGLYNAGTAFRITTGGDFSTIHEFTQGLDGGSPNGLTLGPDQNFYGTAQSGGSNNWGCVFSMTTGGSVSTLYSFTDGSDGGVPTGTVIFGPHGLLFGATSSEGAGGNAAGTVFVMPMTGGSPLTIYTFGNVWSNGAYPTATLTNGPAGKNGMTVYGSTKAGGNGNGTIFGIFLSVPDHTYFAAEAGSYAGLVNGGIVNFTLSADGAFTGKMSLNGVTQSLAGTLDFLGGFNSAAKAKAPLSMILENSGAGGAGSYCLTGSAGGVSYTAWHAAYSKSQSAPEAGDYSVQLAATSNASGIPQTSSDATLAISKAGAVHLSGKLPDGSAFSAAGIITGGPSGDETPLYSQITYKHTATRGAKGTLTGLMTFPANVPAGPLDWTKPAQTAGPYPAAFETGLSVTP